MTYYDENETKTCILAAFIGLSGPGYKSPGTDGIFFSLSYVYKSHVMLYLQN